jgi:hypothetical protein
MEFLDISYSLLLKDFTSPSEKPPTETIPTHSGFKNHVYAQKPGFKMPFKNSISGQVFSVFHFCSGCGYADSLLKS